MKQIKPGLRHQCANVGVGILIFLSICLCGLVAFQWVVQSRLREMVETEKAEGNKLRGERQDLENKSRRYSDEISNITELKAKLEEERKVTLTSLRQTTNDLIRLRMEFNYATNVLSQISNALVQANTNLLIQNKNITDLAAQTKKAMEDRNEIAVKFNEKAKQYGDLVTNYNAVVQQFEDFQKQVKEMMDKQNKKDDK
ncbi:MAG: hypothetical protein J0M24_06275 [Verrucomicrobia bacterium]|nr:hypothetical protein [Verrucomicrobiota bacterium]